MIKNNQLLEYTPKKFEEPKTLLIRNILVPFDDSAISFNAYNIAIDLAKKYHAKLHVLSVMYSSVMNSSFLDITAHQTEIERSRLKRLRNEFKDLKSAATKYGIPFVAEVVISSSVAESILSYASYQKVDLIVMGTRGRVGGPRHLRLGSIAVDVSQNSMCPVMLVK